MLFMARRHEYVSLTVKQMLSTIRDKVSQYNKESRRYDHILFTYLNIIEDLYVSRLDSPKFPITGNNR